MQGLQPGERALRIFGSCRVEPGDVRPGWPRDHDDRQAERPGGEQFGDCGRAAGIFGDDDFDTVFGEHLLVRSFCERATRRDDVRARRQSFGRRRIHAADGVIVPSCGGERGEVLAADGQQHPARGFAQCGGGIGHVEHLHPVIASFGLPGWPLDHQDGDVRCPRGGNGIGTHLHGEGMGGDDERLDAVVQQVTRDPGNAAKTAAAPGDFRQARCGSAAGKREGGAEIRVAHQQRRECEGFSGAAQDEEF